MVGDLEIHTDGGSRGNPGPAACGFVAEENGSEIFKGSKYLGHQTNNFAEYYGIVLALEWLTKQSSNLQISNKQIFFYLDSELVVRQLNGIYKIKNSDLQSLSQKIKKIILENKMKVVFKNVPREKNKIADGLVNKELDKQ